MIASALRWTPWLACAVLAPACSEYEFTKGADDARPEPKDTASGGDDSGAPDPDPAPDIAVDPLSIDYGSVQNGTSASEVVHISNEGDATLNVSGVAITLGLDRGYTVTLPRDLPWPLPPESGEDVVVAFSPLDPGQAIGTLTVASDDPDEPEVPVELLSEGDGCYDPSSAYDQHAAAGLVVTDEGTSVAATYDGSDAGYTSELYLTSPSVVYIATGHSSSSGTRAELGTFAAGTELVFAIHVTDNGQWFYSGPAARNSDGQLHGAVTYQGGCKWTVGFEDSWGGGDQDFNDITMTIEGALEMQIVM